MRHFKTKYLPAGALVLLFLLPLIGGAAGRSQQPQGHYHSDGSFHEGDHEAHDRERVNLPVAPQPVDTALFEITEPVPIDSLAEYPADSLARDTTRRRKKAFLEDILSGKNRDSLFYDVRGRTVYIYKEGDVSYQNLNLKADFMRVNMDDKLIHAYGQADTVDGKPVVTHPIFTEGSAAPRNMDTITYNLDTRKAKIKGVASQEGDGWLIGGEVKMVDKHTMYVHSGMYTTCDHIDHPHFYLKMTKSKVMPNNKVVTGPAYMVIEDVPFYLFGIPEGFFPLSTGPKSGLLMPTFGEETRRGFFLRDLGYYFTMGQHMDLAVYGSIYTLGSWDARAAMHYMKRYKHTGNLNFDYSSIRMGDKGEADFVKQNAFKLVWTHSQDPKANPGSTFSASVNFSTSNSKRYAPTSLQDALQTSTGSTISYSKSWAGTPYSLSTSISLSQNSSSKMLNLTFPNLVFNVGNVYPFKRKEAMGPARWYEKISLRYTGRVNGSASAKESEVFERKTFDEAQFNVEHSLPVSASYNILGYINLTPSANYSEKWYFRSREQVWNPETGQVDILDPKYGFYRLYNYNFAMSASTTVYGMFEAKKPTNKIRAIRHTITPTVSFSYAPDFSGQKYSWNRTVQSDSLGTMKKYSPYEGNMSAGRSLSINGTLSQTLEMKVLDKRDTSGVRKIKIIDEFKIGPASYNFVKDSMRLAERIPLSLRTTIFKNFGINVTADLDPYRITPQGQRYDKLFFPGRLSSAGTSLSYTFNSREDRSIPAINDPASLTDPLYANPFSDPYGEMDPVMRRTLMSQAYYDFSIPWNLTVNYAIRYNAQLTNNGTTGYRKVLTQTLGINGSITILPKMGLVFSSGYDFEARKISATSISLTRDLHCWQMTFSWIPFGRHQSWAFHIGVTAASLKDLKYDKSQSGLYDNMY